jgi:uncharacterized protein YcaQ
VLSPFGPVLRDRGRAGRLARLSEEIARLAALAGCKRIDRAPGWLRPPVAPD